MEQKYVKIGYKDVFTQKEYLKHIVANSISRFGDSIDAIAFTWLVYAITGSAAWSAIVFAINQLPSVLIQPFVGPVIEGMNKKKVMIITDFIRGGIIIGLVILYLTEYLNPWVLLLFTFCNSTVEAFSMPAFTAVVPKIIEEKYYTYGTALSSTISTIVQLAGTAAGGVIIGVWGVETAILIDGVSFFAAGLLRTFLRLDEKNLRKGKLEFKEYFETLKEGAVYIKKQPVIYNFCLMAIITNAILVPINALQTPLITEVMGQGSELLSVFSMAMFIGMLIGSVVFPLIMEKMQVRTVVVITGISIGSTFFLYTMGIYVQGNIVAIYLLTMIASVILGISTSMLSSVLNVQFMKVVSQEYLARVAAIFSAGACAATPIVSMLVSVVSTQLTVLQIFFISGILCVILFVMIGIVKVRLE